MWLAGICANSGSAVLAGQHCAVTVLRPCMWLAGIYANSGSAVLAGQHCAGTGTKALYVAGWYLC